VYNPAWETTQKVVAERRQQVLRKLTVQPVGARTTAQAAELAAAALATDPADIPFVLSTWSSHIPDLETIPGKRPEGVRSGRAVSRCPQLGFRGLTPRARPG
jgi:hypothetical protein